MSTKKLQILEKSLIKKELLFDQKIEVHFNSVKQANGQPLNDKKNGQSTLNKWDKQNDSLRNLNEEIKKTKEAIEIEKDKIKCVDHVNSFIPKEILSLVESKELIQWRKHPNMFFVSGVDKARIIWDNKRNVVAHKYVSAITEQDQRSKFVKIYNSLNQILNK